MLLARARDPIDRHPDLHLARRCDRHAALRGDAARGRARRSGAPAARRRQHRRPRSDLALLDAQPNIELRLYNPFVGRGTRVARIPGRLRAPEPAHAQQVVHGRQPGRGRRRPQHRGRVLRGGREESLADLDVHRHRRGRAGGVDRSSTSTGTAPPPTPRTSIIEPASRPSSREDSRSGRRRRSAESRGDARSTPTAVARTPQVQDLLEGKLNIRVDDARASSTTIPPRRCSRATKPTWNCCPSCRRHSATRRMFDLVSPYFVPGDKGTEALAALARSGVCACAS